MPCNSDHLKPTEHERESVRVRAFLREVGITPKGKDDGCYGNVSQLDADASMLCKWCSNHKHSVGMQSLELQIWWRDHQKADAEREAEEKSEKEAKRLRQSALAKLTTEERRVLGL